MARDHGDAQQSAEVSTNPPANGCTGFERVEYSCVFTGHIARRNQRNPVSLVLAVLSVPPARLGILSDPRIAGVVRPSRLTERISRPAVEKRLAGRRKRELAPDGRGQTIRRTGVRAAAGIVQER